MASQKIENMIVTYEMSVRDTIAVIDRVGKGIALVIDANKKLIGIVTDGDIRRSILKNISLEVNVSEVMNPNFTFVTKDYSNLLVENLFNIKPIKQIPVVDDNMNVMDVIFYSEFYSKPSKDNYALIMAGGLGSRLSPLTRDIPKPMLKVGTKPILETIIEQLKSYGYVNILISVNYKSEVIKNYFQDGSSFGVYIQYIDEEKRMGTAGAIRLAEKFLKKPFFVVNGDILTKLNYESFMEHHINNNNQITIASKKYDMQVPYGVIDLDNNKVNNIKEKPSYSFFINGGMYCLSPDVIKLIPKGEYYDITKLIETLCDNKQNIGSFPIREYWLDIGHIDDYNQANKDYEQLFNKIELS